MRVLLLGLGILLQGGLTFADQFEVVFKDTKNGLSWGPKLSGRYSNGCVDVNGKYEESKCTTEIGADGSPLVKVDDSDVAKACQKLGARLPNKSELESLIRNFDHVEQFYGPVLTFAGLREMGVVLGATEHEYLWSSSVKLSYNGHFAWVFDGVEGEVSQANRFDLFSVRCVSR